MSGDQSEEEAAAAEMGSREPSTVPPSALPAPAQLNSPSGSFFGSVSNELDTLEFTIGTGENVYWHILNCREGRWGVCILAARGAISDMKFTLPVAGGHFARSPYEIVTMSGLFLPPDDDHIGDVGVGTMTTYLVDSYGDIFGGVVDGLLIAASPVKVILGIFKVAATNLGSSSPGALPKSPKLKLAGPSSSTSSRPV